MPKLLEFRRVLFRAVHAAVPSPPPTPRTAPAAGFAEGSRSATLLIAGLGAINRRVTLSFHGTCPTLLLSAASSHARLPKAHVERHSDDFVLCRDVHSSRRLFEQ